MDSGKIVKIAFKDDFRRFKLTGELRSLERLRAKVTSLFDITDPEWRLLYADSDGDHITIADNDDLALAVESAGGARVVRLFIRSTQAADTHPVHPHPLALSDSATPWICDGSDRVGGCRSGACHGPIRYRCTAGCDFDLCEKCMQDRTPGMAARPLDGRNFHAMVGNLTDTLRQHGIDVCVDLERGGCPARGRGRGRGRRGGGCHWANRCRKVPGEEEATTAPVGRPAEADDVASAGSDVPPVPTPAAPVPEAPSAPPSTASSSPSDETTATPPPRWANELQILRDMGISIDRDTLLNSLDRHNGVIAGVLTEVLR
jgi:hypothetical protein